MFSKKILFLSLLLVGVLVTGCGKKAKSAPAPKISFNISGADALGGKEITSNRAAYGARAATVENSALVKIMQNGTLESAISAKISEIEDLPKEDKERMTHWGKLTDVFLPPKGSNCSDVYLLFDGPTYFPAENQDKPGHIEFWSLSQLICIHSDNSYTDILYDTNWMLSIMPIGSKKNIQIADDGTLFVLYREGGGWQYFIRKYDPATKKVSEVCRVGREAPLVGETEGWTEDDWKNSNIYVNKMQISKDGKYAYIQIQKPTGSYLHVVSVENPASYVDLDLGEYGHYCCWDYIYDTNGGKLFYVTKSYNESIVHSADYAGNYKSKVKELSSVQDYCNALIAAEGKIWIKYEGVDCIVLDDIDTAEEDITIPFTANNAWCGENYIVKDNAVYMCYGYGDNEYINDDWVYFNNNFYRVSLTDKSVVEYTASLPGTSNNEIITWSIGDSKVYITGKNGSRQSVSYSMNLDGSNCQAIAEGQVFTCIGSLK